MTKTSNIRSADDIIREMRASNGYHAKSGETRKGHHMTELFYPEVLDLITEIEGVSLSVKSWLAKSLMWRFGFRLISSVYWVARCPVSRLEEAKSQFLEAEIEFNYWIGRVAGSLPMPEIIETRNQIFDRWAKAQPADVDLVSLIPESFKADVLSTWDNNQATKAQFAEDIKAWVFGVWDDAMRNSDEYLRPGHIRSREDAIQWFEYIGGKAYDWGVSLSNSATNKRGQFAIDAMTAAGILEHVYKKAYRLSKEAEASANDEIDGMLGWTEERRVAPDELQDNDDDYQS